MIKGFAGKKGLSAATVAALVALAAGGGWAVAASGGGVIHACASKRSGVLRVAQHCKRNERAVNWNIAGQAGLSGQMGPRGPQGPGTVSLRFDAGAGGASPSPTQFATAGPFTFSYQCENSGGVTAEAVVSVTSTDPWAGYGTLSTEDTTTGPPATTSVVTRGVAAGATDTLIDVSSSSTDQIVTAGDYQLTDQNSDQVYEVKITAGAFGGGPECDGQGAAILPG